MVPGGSTY